MQKISRNTHLVGDKTDNVRASMAGLLHRPCVEGVFRDETQRKEQ